MPGASPAEVLAKLFHGRRSVRGFLPEAVPQETLEELFALAQRAPSWCNIQPWRLTLTHPPVTDSVRGALLEAARNQVPNPDVPFPMDYPEPYQAHRRACGKALYTCMEVARDDKEGRYDAWLRNYELFDAPHLVVVSRDQRLGEYATLDVGVWLGFFLAAAEALGVGSCAMASVAAYPEVLRQALNLPEEERILFGIALGYVDESVPANKTRTDRDPASANLRQRQ